MLESGTEIRRERINEVLSKRQKSITAIFENLHDPHNLMACLRSCDAIGVYEVYIINCELSKKPKKIGHGSSSSAKKWIKQNKYIDVKTCFDKLKDEGKKIYTTHLSADAKSIYDVDFTEPVALMFGNERDGISDEALSLADGNIVIPQIGMIKSLNISVACAVSLYEVHRQRLFKNNFNFNEIQNIEYQNIFEQWIMPSSIKKKM